MSQSRRSKEWLGPPPNGRGRAIVVSGPSGSGKSTLVRKIAIDPSIHVSISATTRPPGRTDRDGVDYYFLSREELQAGIDAGRFIEHAEYGGNLYGTPREPLDEALGRGRWALLEIEVQGALQVRQLYPDALLVFIEPPDEQTLRARLAQRGRDTAEVIERRMEIARWEMQQKHLYDFSVVNDELAVAVHELKQQIKAHTLG